LRLVIIDDHPLVLQGIESIVDMENDIKVVGTATSGEQAVELLQETQPDIAMVDLRLPGESGLDIIKMGKEIAPECRFIILTSYSGRADVQQAMEQKVAGYLLKEALPEEILAAICLVAKGRTYIDPGIMQLVYSQDKHDPIEQLTSREKQVLAAIAEGKSNREIAHDLYVTEYTVKKHMSQILSKLEVSDRTQAAIMAIEKGWGRQEIV
jgi:DNA-binding NarL/FixJ family response regulator